MLSNVKARMAAGKASLERQEAEAKAALHQTVSAAPDSHAWEYCRLTYGYGEGFDLSLCLVAQTGKRHVFPVQVDRESASGAIMHRLSQLGISRLGTLWLNRYRQGSQR